MWAFKKEKKHLPFFFFISLFLSFFPMILYFSHGNHGIKILKYIFTWGNMLGGSIPPTSALPLDSASVGCLFGEWFTP
jgi:hypothetical protein